MDNTFGYAFFAARVGNGFTANLNVNYRKPVVCGQEVMLKIWVKRIERRKVFMEGQILSRGPNPQVLTEATCLFIVSQDTQHLQQKQVLPPPS